jgi:hypothetical protein
MQALHADEEEARRMAVDSIREDAHDEVVGLAQSLSELRKKIEDLEAELHERKESERWMAWELNELFRACLDGPEVVAPSLDAVERAENQVAAFLNAGNAFPGERSWPHEHESTGTRRPQEWKVCGKCNVWYCAACRDTNPALLAVEKRSTLCGSCGLNAYHNEVLAAESGREKTRELDYQDEREPPAGTDGLDGQS